MIKSNPCSDLVTRQINAMNSFVEAVQEQFGKSKEQAEKVLSVFRKAKAVKFDTNNGQWTLSHGAFWDADVINRAIDL